MQTVKDFREVLKIEMAKRRLKVTDLADMMGFHFTTLYRLMRGGSDLQEGHLNALCRGLDLKIHITRADGTQYQLHKI